MSEHIQYLKYSIKQNVCVYCCLAAAARNVIDKGVFMHDAKKQ